MRATSSTPTTSRCERGSRSCLAGGEPAYAATQARRDALVELHDGGRRTWAEVAGLVGLSRARVVELVGGPRRR